VNGSDRPELSLVMPVYNEAENVGPVLAGLQVNVRTPHEILVVYDFDEDTTLPVVRARMPDQPTIRLCRNGRGPGVLNAMRAGFDAAAAPFIVVTMADGSDDPADVDRMVERAREGVDLVAASRYMPGGRQIGGPRLKGWLSRLAGLSLHWIGRVPIHDPTSNFKLYRRSGDRADRESHAGRPRAGRGPDHLARSNRGPEPVSPTGLAAALPPLVRVPLSRAGVAAGATISLR
jgi:glycosyltransferase involved in cell wall biosynthesis